MVNSQDTIQGLVNSQGTIQGLVYSKDTIQGLVYSKDTIQGLVYSKDTIQGLINSKDTIQGLVYSKDTYKDWFTVCKYKGISKSEFVTKTQLFFLNYQGRDSRRAPYLAVSDPVSPKIRFPHILMG